MSDPTIIAPSAVPKHIINAITQYGDSRADDGLASGPALGKVIAAINEHYGPALRATLPAAPAPTEQAGDLPPLPYWWAELEKNDKVLAHQFKNNMEDYARAALAARQTRTEAPKEPQGYTDGGRNMFFTGLFEGETEREQTMRLKWADSMRAAFEKHFAQGWFDKDWRAETGIWSAAWSACIRAARQAPDSRDAAAVLPPPIGYARKQDLLTYSPAWMAYSAKPAAENGHEAVALFSEDQVRAAIAKGKAQ